MIIFFSFIQLSFWQMKNENGFPFSLIEMNFLLLQSLRSEKIITSLSTGYYEKVIKKIPNQIFSLKP
jgi:hypothetical protein